MNDGHTALQMRRAARDLLRFVDAKILIVDEIHRFVGWNPSPTGILLSALRLLASDLKLPLILAGTTDAKRALMTDRQLADRFEAMELPPWHNDDSYARLLASFSVCSSAPASLGACRTGGSKSPSRAYPRDHRSDCASHRELSRRRDPLGPGMHQSARFGRSGADCGRPLAAPEFSYMSSLAPELRILQAFELALSRVLNRSPLALADQAGRRL